MKLGQVLFSLLAEIGLVSAGLGISHLVWHFARLHLEAGLAHRRPVEGAADPQGARRKC